VLNWIRMLICMLVFLNQLRLLLDKYQRGGSQRTLCSVSLEVGQRVLQKLLADAMGKRCQYAQLRMHLTVQQARDGR
jgi:hypothetical protein